MNSRINKLILVSLLSFLILSCSQWQEQSRIDVRPTLADIELTVSPQVKTTLVKPSIAMLIKDYRELIALSSEPVIKEQLNYRLAQLLLIENEQAQESGDRLSHQAAGYYDDAINAFNTFLVDYPSSSQREHLLYQLAKAYELQGESELSFQTVTTLTTEFPATRYGQELYFRRGEYLFAANRYRAAARSYQQVITGDINSPFYQTALYMLAWAEFKRENHSQALLHFTHLLDISLPQRATTDIEVAALPVATRRMVQDSLRVMGLIFSDGSANGVAVESGAQALAQHFERVGPRYYEYLNYQHLAMGYLKHKRYRDSAETYGEFVKRYPTHVKSPHFMVSKIETYQRGRFAALANNEKRQFVADYGINGPYWRIWSGQDKTPLMPKLKTYLVEFAEQSYRIAQDKKQQGYSQRSMRGSKNQADVTALYADAARWFLEYQHTFNDSAKMNFLYAESLFASGQYSQAIDAYLTFAYQRDGTKVADTPLNSQNDEALYQTNSKRADAAYAALLAYDKVLQQVSNHTAKVSASQMRTITSDNEAIDWLQAYELSAQQFIDTFADDERSLAVLSLLMHQRFNGERFIVAMDSARQLLNWPHEVAGAQQLDARMIIAHSQFNLQDYQHATASYQQVLSMLKHNDPRLTSITENYAASLFKQAEQHIEAGRLAQGTELFIRVIEQAPTSSVRKLAQFNAAQNLYQLNELARATHYLIDFRQRFTTDKLAKDIETQLISIYVEENKWAEAASEYLMLVNKLNDKTLQQQPLFMAASYFEKAGDIELARLSYRRYAHAYSQPFSRAIEVRFTLSEIYRESGEQSKRRFWLRKLLNLHDNTPEQVTSRSTALAAMSAMVFARDAQAEFDRIKLTLPLRKSLQRKKRSLTNALKAYQKAASYNLAKYTTESTFQMAQIYRQLAQDLLNSSRPSGLDELALAQYEILLEEQAYPFEDKAIAILESNTQLSWQGLYDEWVKQSFATLSELMPGRYNKQETFATTSALDGLY
ncbi:tetratricopeptide repeat protein [Psychrobium sp. 1_MG-2023]|uniref:tetratricopeptide repeat protein n=1 Tax=Psychrobium sp. 1_MG-2023 TaxID=3062624 RepID=UPI00267CA73A|nr:tetratricopeptide repeat protein [Psychrobium sp. 1_MG-2023]MDP2562856.1 tetratricopeptide repeat protein [Psychrobium sp. 1_MG-2023]